MQINYRLKCNVDKYLEGIGDPFYKEKKNQKKKEKVWAIAHTLMIRFSEALTSMHDTWKQLDYI